jgi:hypothetical protein
MWLLAGVYLAVALIIAILTGPTLVRNSAAQVESISGSQRLAAK